MNPEARFEAAADAVVDGDVATLARLLAEDPGLARARSSRPHRATFLHYVAANGVEDERQRSPRNAVEVAKLLLDAGADAQATCDAYGGGSTVLMLTATSIHPLRAGVQDDLMALLVAHGARPDAASVRACLWNGRGGAASWLARHGAPLDLEGAAGVGRLDVVEARFDAEPALRPAALAWASQYGHARVVEALLARGMSVHERVSHGGQTALHWAAVNAHEPIVRLLLARGADPNAIEERWRGTCLDWLLHGFREAQDREPYYASARLLRDAGGRAATPVADERMRGIVGSDA